MAVREGDPLTTGHGCDSVTTLLLSPNKTTRANSIFVTLYPIPESVVITNHPKYIRGCMTLDPVKVTFEESREKECEMVREIFSYLSLYPSIKIILALGAI